MVPGRQVYFVFLKQRNEWALQRCKLFRDICTLVRYVDRVLRNTDITSVLIHSAQHETFPTVLRPTRTLANTNEFYAKNAAISPAPSSPNLSTKRRYYNIMKCQRNKINLVRLISLKSGLITFAFSCIKLATISILYCDFHYIIC